MTIDWLEIIIRYLGIAVLAVILMAMLLGALLAMGFFVVKFTPRLHFGRPNSEGELCFYDLRTITTGKNGQSVEGNRRMISAPLGIKWWVGLSYRSAPKWFVGLIRWESKS